MPKHLIWLVILALTPMSLTWASTYSEFVRTAFPKAEPSMASLWLNAEIKQVLLDKFDYRLDRIRVKYWQDDLRSALDFGRGW